MAKVIFAWELGGHTGHVATLLPVARAMQRRGHDVQFLLRDLKSGADLAGTSEIPRAAAPIWVGRPKYENPLNFGQILHNFGYQHAHSVRQLVDAWRERLADADAVVANVAPAAHLAARTLGIPSFEISQGFHVPPPGMPAAPLRHWEPAPRSELEACDQAVLASVNATLGVHGAAPLASIGDLFSGRAMLLTYPELDIYPERGPAEYYGITRSFEGSSVPAWPEGRGPRVFGYLYNYFAGLDPLLVALERAQARTLLLCRGAHPDLVRKHAGSSVRILNEPMTVSRLLPHADLVVCHGSHQMTAQSLLAGKPLLMLPTQLEQFLIMRRVVRFGAGLGIDSAVPDADYGAAISTLGAEGHTARARVFAARYATHDPESALATLLGRVEAGLEGREA
ncbi:MAG: glycosyltransferase [Gammaproteobacteria bacterium]